MDFQKQIDCIETLFKSVVPEGTYNVVQWQQQVKSWGIPCVLDMDNSDSIFDTPKQVGMDVEYKMIATAVRIANASSDTSKQLLFKRYVALILDRYDYNKDVATLIAIAWALIIGTDRYLGKYGRFPLNRKAFVEEYLEYGSQLCLYETVE